MKSIAKMARRGMIERVVNFVGGAKDWTSGKPCVCSMCQLIDEARDAIHGR